MKDQTEDPTPVAQGRGAAPLAEHPPGDTDLLTLCEIWRALDFVAPCHCECACGKEGR